MGEKQKSTLKHYKKLSPQRNIKSTITSRVQKQKCPVFFSLFYPRILFPPLFHVCFLPFKSFIPYFSYLPSFFIHVLVICPLFFQHSPYTFFLHFFPFCLPLSFFPFLSHSPLLIQLFLSHSSSNPIYLVIFAFVSNQDKYVPH